MMTAEVIAEHPAGALLDRLIVDTADHLTLRVALDFDGMLADGAEHVCQEQGVEAARSGAEQENDPRGARALRELLGRIAQLQEIEKARAASERGYERRLAVAVVTGRNAPALKRVVASLRPWGVTVDQGFLLAGMDKSRVLKTFRPHLVFAERQLRLDGAVAMAPRVHVPAGGRRGV